MKNACQSLFLALLSKQELREEICEALVVLSPSGHPLAYGVLRILTPGRAMKEPTSGSRVDTGTCVLYRQILVLIKKNFFFSFFA